MLPSGFACARTAPPTTVLGAAMQAMTILIHQRLLLDIASYAGAATLHVLPPPCPVTVAPSSFGHAGRLIRAAHDRAAAALDEPVLSPPQQAAAIGLHRH
ncbi:hypothetical protein [Nocardioides daejeonensis]|uniref:hypothetical protein n=1 Tax=Nocardioides daejeonensis TaxID=1046556 RepID=UPI001EF71303|nr:hypothetical protein [Nocardioides daejeonensis]